MRDPREGEVWGIPGQPATYRTCTGTWLAVVWYVPAGRLPTMCSMADWKDWAKDKQSISLLDE